MSVATLHHNKLRLPDGISVVKDGNRYVILKDECEEIGGVILEGTALGDTQLRPYLSESQHHHRYIVASIVQQMADALLEHVAQKPAGLRRDVLPPDNIPEGVEVFENKIFTCSKCNKIIAKLIFSWESKSFQAIEAAARKFELEASLSAYPIWIIGASDGHDDRIANHLTLQIAPIKGKVYWEHPSDMNQRLIELDNNHC